MSFPGINSDLAITLKTFDVSKSLTYDKFPKNVTVRFANILAGKFRLLSENKIFNWKLKLIRRKSVNR